MDNITHTLVGLAVAEAAMRLRARRGALAAKTASSLRPALWFASAIANNFPDLDGLYAARVTEGKFGYLLHHRGHTHTLLAVLPQAALILAGFLLWNKFRRADWSRADWGWLSAITLLGIGLHIFMDYQNSYGVHPFWPFDNRWYYGDTLFIVEPWFWVTLAPALIRAATSRGAKAVLALVFAAGPGLVLFTGLVPWQPAVMLTLVALCLLGLMTKLGPGARIALSLGSGVAVLTLMALASASTRAGVSRILSAQFPRATTSDIAVSPFPANPFCWQIIAVQTEGTRYLVRRGNYALAPRFFGADECPKFLDEGATTPLRPVPAPLRPELVWSGQFEAPLGELRAMAASNCGVSALLRFMRAPVWSHRHEGDMIFGDLRFDRKPTIDFAEVPFGPDAHDDACPKSLPPWTAPRAPLLAQ